LFQTCMSFFLLLNTKEDILKNLTEAIGLRGIFFLLWKSMAPVNCLITNIL